MLNQINIRLLYLLSFLFLVLGIVGVALEQYWVLALPLVPVVYILLVYKPKYILYFLAFSTPLSVHLIEERVSTINLSLPTEPLIIVVFGLLLIKLLQIKSLNFKEVKTLLSILIIVDVGWTLFTTLTSTMPLISAKFLLSKIWYLGVFYFLLSRLFQNRKVALTFIWCFIVAVVILSFYTLYNHSLGSFTRDYAYTAMRPFLPDHGMYAACISFAAPVLFVFLFYGNDFKYSGIQRIAIAGLFAFLLVAIALSFTRASWVSIAAAFGVYVVLLLGIKFRYLLFIAIIAIAAVAVNLDDLLTDLSRNKNESDDNIENHLQSVGNVSSDPSNLERLNRWSCGLRMFEEKPVAGFGPGTYTFQYGAFQLPHQMTIISSNSGSQGGIHSEYLRPLAESGVLGAALFIAIVLASFAIGFRQFYNLKGRDRALSLAVFLGLVTYFTHAVLNNYSDFDKIAVPLYSFMAVLTAIEVTTHNAKKDSTK